MLFRSPELPRRIDVKHGEWRKLGVECFPGEVKQNRGVLANRVQKNRFAELSSCLAEDMYPLGLEQIEMR